MPKACWDMEKSLLNGSPAKKKDKPFDLICLQETWYNDNQNTIHIPDYKLIAKNRDGFRGGCAFYIHNTITFNTFQQNHLSNIEAQIIQIYYGDESFYVVNYYNPCKKLQISILEALISQVREGANVIVLGDFNSHNPIWGSPTINQNGEILENFIAEND